MSKIVTCSAIIENKDQKENLCECIRIVGGEPIIKTDTIETKLPYPSEAATKMIMLFEHYWRHKITITEK